MIFIVIVNIIIYFIAIAWSWHSLGEIEKPKKIIYVLIGIFIMYIITLIITQLTKGQIHYENAQMQKDVQNMIITIFTGVNSIIINPQIGKIIDEMNNEQIEKEVLKKRIIILLIIFIICVILESGYIKDIQDGIIKIYEAQKK